MAVIAIKKKPIGTVEAHTAPALGNVSANSLRPLIAASGRRDAGSDGRQVKHNKIFSAIRPDWKTRETFVRTPEKEYGQPDRAVAKVLEDEGILLVDSTVFLKPLLSEAGVLTRRAPSEEESADMAYGVRTCSKQLRAWTSDRPSSSPARPGVAVEAMEARMKPSRVRRALRRANRWLS